MFVAVQINAQHTIVNQIIVGSGGIYGDTTNNVTLSSFNPGNEFNTEFGDIFTQSIQDIIIDGSFAYVAAQDSIAKFNIDTYEKVSCVEASGINKLYVNGNNLFASFQFPATENFVRVYSTDELSHIGDVSEVSDESAGLLVIDEYLYVAVPGGWASTVGKIAIIDINDFSLINEVDFDGEGLGIYDLFLFEEQIISVNKTPWGGTQGYISVMDKMGSNTESHIIEGTIGKMAGLKGNTLYTIMNNSIGSINLTDFSIDDTAVVPAASLTIVDATFDTVNNLFYVTTTDYFSIGEGLIYNMNGEETGSFDAGISAESIAIDYRDNTGIYNHYDNELKIYPIPALHMITVESINGLSYGKYRIIDTRGRVIQNGIINLESNNANIDISLLETGLYFFEISNDNEKVSKTFIKN